MSAAKHSHLYRRHQLAVLTVRQGCLSWMDTRLIAGRYTFTELATGGDLWSFIYRHGKDEPISEYETRVMMRQVARGLHYLHSKGVIHRDLKPENILLAYSPKVNCHRVMLSDFGAYAVPRRSRMMTCAGTRNYQAP